MGQVVLPTLVSCAIWNPQAAVHFPIVTTLVYRQSHTLFRPLILVTRLQLCCGV